MKTTFNHINNFINNKEDYVIKDGDEFVPYMIQRWISMISPELCFILNETTNSNWASMEDKQMWHDYFISAVPRVGRKKLSYMRKDKTPPSEDVKEIAERLEISCKEAKELLEIDSSLNDKEKSLEVYKK